MWALGQRVQRKGGRRTCGVGFITIRMYVAALYVAPGAKSRAPLQYFCRLVLPGAPKLTCGDGAQQGGAASRKRCAAPRAYRGAACRAWRAHAPLEAAYWRALVRGSCTCAQARALANYLNVLVFKSVCVTLDWTGIPSLVGCRSNPGCTPLGLVVYGCNLRPVLVLSHEE